MSDLRFFIDGNAIAKEFGDLKQEVQKALDQGVKTLAQMTHAKTAELASAKLNSTRKLYLDNLKFEEVAEGLYVVSLDQPAMFIEEGRKAGSMLPDLLKKNAKISKDGHKYKAIPFDNAKPPSQNTPFANNLIAKIKSEFKKEGIPYKKLELDANGSPRLGKLHTMNIDSPHPSAKASHPALSGLTVYQTQMPNGKVRRDIMTFRMASTAHPEKWIHPGLDPQNFMDSAMAWAEKEWDEKILPEIMERFK